MRTRCVQQPGGLSKTGPDDDAARPQSSDVLGLDERSTRPCSGRDAAAELRASAVSRDEFAGGNALVLVHVHHVENLLLIA
jgi:hypothetical protein